MAEILNRFNVVKALTKIIEEADNEILLISPYIKLNAPLRNGLSKHKDKKDFKLVVVYGKNDEDKRMSLSDTDFEFFKSFPQVEIRYHTKLHAKIYANDFDLLITSMNLHNYSMKENIEVGIFLKMNLLRDLGSSVSLVSNSLEMQARDFADYIITHSEIQYQAVVNKSSSFLGLFAKYEESKIAVNKQRTGFCIRTKDIIPFNLNHPYNEMSFKSWVQYKNKNYKERYCHACGKPNQSSMNKPVCYECFHSNK